MSALFLELARIVLFISFSLTSSDWEWYPQWSNCKSASCGEACHTQASYVCSCCFFGWTSCHKPCRQAYGHCAAIFLGIGNDFKALSKTSGMQGFHRGRYTDKWSVYRPFPGFGIFTKLLLREQYIVAVSGDLQRHCPRQFLDSCAQS